MFKFLFRTIGLWIMAAALVAVVIDGMKSVAVSRLVLTPLEATWTELHPPSLESAKAAAHHYAPGMVSTTVVPWLLAQPTWAVLGVIGAFFILIGARRSRRIVFSR